MKVKKKIRPHVAKLVIHGFNKMDRDQRDELFDWLYDTVGFLAKNEDNISSTYTARYMK